MISEWLIVDENNQVSIDNEGVKSLRYIGRTYNTFGKTRKLKTSYGPTIEVKGGDYGWWLNRGKEVEELTELIKAGAKLTKEPAYLQKAAHYGDDDVGDTYVEVNITAQHLFFIRWRISSESDFVSEIFLRVMLILQVLSCPIQRKKCHLKRRRLCKSS